MIVVVVALVNALYGPQSTSTDENTDSEDTEKCQYNSSVVDTLASGCVCCCGWLWCTRLWRTRLRCAWLRRAWLWCTWLWCTRLWRTWLRRNDKFRARNPGHIALAIVRKRNKRRLGGESVDIATRRGLCDGAIPATVQIEEVREDIYLVLVGRRSCKLSRTRGATELARGEQRGRAIVQHLIEEIIKKCGVSNVLPWKVRSHVHAFWACSDARADKRQERTHKHTRARHFLLFGVIGKSKMCCQFQMLLQM
jgi:hypothetical protein